MQRDTSFTHSFQNRPAVLAGTLRGFFVLTFYAASRTIPSARKRGEIIYISFQTAPRGVGRTGGAFLFKRCAGGGGHKKARPGVRITRPRCQLSKENYLTQTALAPPRSRCLPPGQGWRCRPLHLTTALVNRPLHPLPRVFYSSQPAIRFL